MANLLWAFFGAFLRALFPVFLKICVRIASKLGRVFVRRGWGGFRAEVSKLLTIRSRRKEKKDSRRRRPRGEEVPEVDEDAGG